MTLDPSASCWATVAWIGLALCACATVPERETLLEGRFTGTCAPKGTPAGKGFYESDALTIEGGRWTMDSVLFDDAECTQGSLRVATVGLLTVRGASRDVRNALDTELLLERVTLTPLSTEKAAWLTETCGASFKVATPYDLLAAPCPALGFPADCPVRFGIVRVDAASLTNGISAACSAENRATELGAPMQRK